MLSSWVKASFARVFVLRREIIKQDEKNELGEKTFSNVAVMCCFNYNSPAGLEPIPTT